MKNITLFLAAFILFLGSCTIQKRVYRPGFTVEWKGDKFQATEAEEVAEENLANTGAENKAEKSDLSRIDQVDSKEIELAQPVAQRTLASNVVVDTHEKQQEKALAAVAKPVSKKVKKGTQFAAGNAFEYKASIGADDEGNGALTGIGWVFIIIGILILIFASILVGILLMLVGLLFFVVGKNN
jgi:membrane-bound lytic murein transglycosylase